MADFTVLSHPEQLERLAAACPEAAPTAVFGGDPCFDRLMEAKASRTRFRRALGMEPGQRLVVLNSTWNSSGFLGDDHSAFPLVLERIAAELPLDEFRVAAVLHPNIVNGQGPGQVRLWLERARRAGLLLIPPLDGWRQTLIAADCLVGDHGSVSYYAAAIGVPVLLAAFPDDDLDPDSPVAEFGRATPRLRTDMPLLPQIERVVAEHRPESAARLAGWATSDPGESAALLRELFYRAMGIPEPGHAAALDRLGLPPVRFAPVLSAVRALIEVDEFGVMAVRRYPESADWATHPTADAAHLVVSEDTPEPDVLARADVILGYDLRGEPVSRWLAETAEAYPYSSMVAACIGPGRADVRHRSGVQYRLECVGCESDPSALVSGLLARIDLGGVAAAEAERGFVVRVDLGGSVHRVDVTVGGRE
ncbi:MAG TPA: hypothetical protein VGX23_01940 [Actinocrinis sp.]|nr:hypothetical protein [Actinocrinis sp.]